MRVALIGPERRDCGIGDYTRALAAELRRRVDVRSVPIELAAREPVSIEADVAHVQYEHGFFLDRDDPAGNAERFFARLELPTLVTLHCLPLEDPRWQRWLASPDFTFHVMSRTYEDALQRMFAGVRVLRTVVPSLPLVEPTESAAAFRARAGLEDRPLLVMFGFVKRHKGYDVAMEALERLPSPVTLVVAGGAHDEEGRELLEELSSRAERHGIADRFHVTGYLDPGRVGAVLGAADLVLAPYHTATSSAALAASLSWGRPAVASDLPQFRELEETCGAPRCFSAGDAEALASVISALLADRAALDALAQRAVVAAAGQSYGRVAEACVHAYAELLGDRGEVPR